MKSLVAQVKAIHPEPCSPFGYDPFSLRVAADWWDDRGDEDTAGDCRTAADALEDFGQLRWNPTGSRFFGGWRLGSDFDYFSTFDHETALGLADTAHQQDGSGAVNWKDDDEAGFCFGLVNFILLPPKKFAAFERATAICRELGCIQRETRVEIFKRQIKKGEM